MAGTKSGGIRIRQTNIQYYGSEEAWKEEMRRRASKGGSAKVPKGFAVSGKAREAGIKGGKISRRGSRNVEKTS
jgi:hypothetical protein